jgi:hypothetical protein
VEEGLIRCRVVRRKHEPIGRKQQDAGENVLMRSFIICAIVRAIETRGTKRVWHAVGIGNMRNAWKIVGRETPLAKPKLRRVDIRLYVADFCQHGNGPSGSRNDREFLD